jgi:hypothetical protein
MGVAKSGESTGIFPFETQQHLSKAVGNFPDGNIAMSGDARHKG